MGKAAGFFGQCCLMDAVMDTNPSLQTFSLVGMWGRKSPLRLCWVGKALQETRERAPAKILLFCLVLSVS